MPKVATIAKLVAREGRRDDLVAALSEVIAAVEAGEPGTEVYALHTSIDDENAVWFYELYTDLDAAKAHSGGDALKSAGPKLAELIGGPVEIMRVKPVAAKGLSF